MPVKIVPVKDVGDEIWLTVNGTPIAVGDMSEDHAKNALRLMIRWMAKIKKAEEVKKAAKAQKKAKNKTGSERGKACVSKEHCNDSGLACCLNPNNV